MFESSHRYDDLADRVGSDARAGRASARRTWNRMNSAEDWRDEAAPVIDRLADRATQVVRNSADWMRDNSDRMRTEVARASDRSLSYVRDEPVRALLMAAAAGALVLALVRMLGRRSDR